MNNFCSKCGQQLTHSENYCIRCGNAVNNSSNAANSDNNENTAMPNRPVIVGVKKREIATAIILSLVTCGIYGLYWFVCLTDESNQLSGSDSASGGMAILYTILTCGIYSFYWNYIMGQKMAEAGKKYGKNIEDRSVLYLVLSLFGFGIVNYCLIQNDINSIAE